MSNNGKQGENLFQQRMQQSGFVVQDVSANKAYFDKDVDFIVTNPATGNVRTFEVKWCYGISKYGNLFLEFINPRSKQWNGEGWWPHCKADFLVYGDAVNKKFYVFEMGDLRKAVEPLWNSLSTGTTNDGSVGKKLPLSQVRCMAIEM